MNCSARRPCFIENLLKFKLSSVSTPEFFSSGDDIHDLSRCHLRCWRSLFSEHCITPWIVFCNITTEYNSTFVFLVFASNSAFFRWQMSINDAKWTVAPLVLPSSIACFSLLFDFCQAPRRNFVQFLPFFIHSCFCCWDFHGLRHWKMCTKL